MPAIVESALMRPHVCGQCKGSKGPFLDTERDGVEGRLYLCKLCTRQDAKAFGFAPGKRLDELAGSEVTVSNLEAQIETILKAHDESKRHIVSLEAQLEGARKQLEEFRGRDQQREHLARMVNENVRQLLAVA